MQQFENFEDLTRFGTQYIIAESVDNHPQDFDPWALLSAWDDFQCLPQKAR